MVHAFVALVLLLVLHTKIVNKINVWCVCVREINRDQRREKQKVESWCSDVQHPNPHKEKMKKWNPDIEYFWTKNKIKLKFGFLKIKIF